MKNDLKIKLFILILCVISSCDKDSTTNSNPTNSPNPTTASCFLKTVTNTGYITSYEFDNKHNLSSVKGPTVDQINNVGSNTITFNYITSSLSLPGWRSVKYEASDITTQLPSKAFVSINDGQITTVNYETYFFFYDTKNQIIKVGQQTDNIVGDWEYDLDISYNEQGNVTALQYKWTTGPNVILPPVIVTAYDDKPNPYAAIKGFPFINANWNSSDPASVIIALSKNNPLNYTFGSGSDIFKRQMTYQYNENGFPIERKNVNKNGSSPDYTFFETFTYNCK